MCKRDGIKHTNECQFYVTLGAPLSFLDGKNVVFGRVIEGFRAFKLIEKTASSNEKPSPAVTVDDCGIFEITKPMLKKQEAAPE